MLIGELICVFVYPDIREALVHDLGHLTACLVAIFVSNLGMRYSLTGKADSERSYGVSRIEVVVAVASIMIVWGNLFWSGY
jgi:Co/Zn/Cd efflux system component